MIRQHVLTLGMALAIAGTTSSEAHAQLRPPLQTEAPPPSSPLTTASVEAAGAGDFAKALSLADEAISKDAKDPWGYFNRGGALRALHRTDEAVSAFNDAEARMPAADLWGRSVAIWGQADALSRDGRCRDAAAVYERYAVTVEKVDRGAAALARQYAQHCTPRPETK
jgi:tetratricopeptide (TPR) repeat protein